MDLEGIYQVYFGNRQAGTVQLTRQGLYYRFQCHCRLSGDVMCRLHVRWDDKEEKLGVLVPDLGEFTLDTRLPVKRFGCGIPRFSLIPRYEIPETGCAPIYPEEPFAYIERLKDAYLVRKDGQILAAFHQK